MRGNHGLEAGQVFRHARARWDPAQHGVCGRVLRKDLSAHLASA